MQLATPSLAPWLSAALLLVGPGIAQAAPAAETGGEARVGEGLGGRARAEASSDEGLSKREDLPWIRRWAPERNMFELGAFGGLLVPARDLELFEPRLTRPRQGFMPLASVAPDVGGRLAFFPFRFVGLEVEGAYMPTTTLEDRYAATLWAVRGHVLAQLPVASVAPFVVVGGGVLSVTSEEAILGQDIDQAFHLGIGTKIFINRRLSARLDLRDIISPRRGIDGGGTNSLEVLVGLSLTLGRKRDRDPEPAPEPTPEPPPPDRDGDGFLDTEDRCPDEPGVAPYGCPNPEDPDGDGFFGADDQCPDEPGIAPDGCPDLDADGDGILIPDDQCPDVPETHNGYQDEDGCDDVVPDDIQRFNGRLEGINFDTGRATLTKASLPILDEAVELLGKHPTIRIEISGHTDNTGSREINMRLSTSRSKTVMQYLVDRGIAADRITTRGAGPDEPIDSNATRVGRAQNRRIEFRVLE